MELIERELENQVWQVLGRGPEAIFIYGPRRSGKSTFCSKLGKRFALERSVNLKVVNFEEPKFTGAKVDEIEKEAAALSNNDLLVLDEVQNVENWERWVRTCVDNKRLNLLVTGSSSKLLSSEFATSIAGRGIGFELLPFSFKEAGRLGISFEEWLEFGGFPAVLARPAEQRVDLLKSYFETALIRDVAARFQIKDLTALRNVSEWLLTEIGKPVSLKKIRSALGISFDSARSYLEKLNFGYVAFTIPSFSYSLQQSLTKPRKAYSFDLGVQKIASKSNSVDFGRKVENAVALELRRREFELYYYQGKREVDFIAKKHMELTAINVCASSKIPSREFEGIEEVKKKLKVKNALILTLGESNEKENVKNVKEWLLEK